MSETNDPGLPSVQVAADADSRNAAILYWMEQLAPHGIFTTDNQLRVRTWNHWLETHSGRSADSVMGQPLIEVFPELVTRKLDDQFRGAIEGQVSVLSTALHGHLLPFPVTVRDSGFQHMQQTARIGPLLLNGAVCGTITTIEDVTQREMQAEAMRQHAEELEDKVRERTSRLDETVAQLESFSYTVAHDLRAPIRTFKGYTEILLEDYGGEFPEKAREYLERMKRAAAGMDLLTRDLLQFSKISRQQIEAEPIDVTELIAEIVTHNPALQTPGRLTVHTPLHPVNGNRTMRSELRHGSDAEGAAALPALPFQMPTPASEQPDDSSSPRLPPRERARVRIFVEDNGIGIAPEHHRQIFGVFERLQGRGKFEGTGIGLAIVARAVQRMNGSCGVESSPNVGSRFWIEMPAAL